MYLQMLIFVKTYFFIILQQQKTSFMKKNSTFFNDFVGKCVWQQYLSKLYFRC